MPDRNLKAVLEAITHPAKSPEHAQLLWKSLSTLNEEEVVELTLEIDRQGGADAVGYLLSPVLRGVAESEFKPFQALVDALHHPKLSPGTRDILLHLLRRVAPEHGDPGVAELVEAVAGFIKNPEYASRSRAFAVRCLGLSRSEHAQKLLLAAATSNDLPLITGAADVLLNWTRADRSYSDKITIFLQDFARMSPGRAADSGPLLRLLAVLGGEENQKLLDRILEASETPRQRDRFLGATGPYLPADRLADVIQKVTTSPSDLTRALLEGLFSQHPKRAMDLFRAKRYEVFLHVVELVPGALRSPEIVGAIRSLLQQPANQRVHALAVGFYHRVVKRPLTRYPLLTWDDDDDDPPLPAGPVRVQNGFATGLQLGDAAYRQLALLPIGGVSSLGEHWHGGLFTGFRDSVDSDVFYMEGIQVDNWANPTSEVERFKAESSTLKDRNTDLVAEMQTLVDGFVAGLEGSATGGYRGARGVPGLGYDARKQIVDTARALLPEWITYCLYDMIQGYPFSGFDGSIEDIFALRCDGLIEYAYEANNVRVMNGEDPNEWNVADHPSNHNHFHGHFAGTSCTNNNYTSGDTCPRIQAGNIASDTTFVSPPDRLPEISDITIQPFCGYRMIRFQVSAIASRFVFVRILVGRANRSGRFILKSEDPTGLGAPQSGWPEDNWTLRREDILSSNGEVALTWNGKTVRTDAHTFTLFGQAAELSPEEPGPDFRGTDDTYEFILQCIDEGGNVSHAWSRTVQVNWK